MAIRRVTADKAPGGDLSDRDGTVAARYGSASAAYLIRPDGYIGFRCPIGEVSRKLPPHLAALFGDPVIGAAPPDRQAD